MFSLGSSADGSGIGKSLDEIIADRRKEQSQTSSGRGANSDKKNKKSPVKKSKKNELVDRSIASGRAKRSAATKQRRGFSDEKKPTPHEIDQENYRQSRRSNASKKNQEQKSSNGRLPPNSSLRDKKKNNSNSKANAKQVTVSAVEKTPSKKQLNAAVQGMKSAGCTIPDGYTMTMKFIPKAATSGKGKGKGGQQQDNRNNKQDNGNNRKGDRGGGRGGNRGGRK